MRMDMLYILHLGWARGANVSLKGAPCTEYNVQPRYRIVSNTAGMAMILPPNTPSCGLLGKLSIIGESVCAWKVLLEET